MIYYTFINYIHTISAGNPNMHSCFIIKMYILLFVPIIIYNVQFVYSKSVRNKYR